VPLLSILLSSLGLFSFLGLSGCSG